jgi:hypothetical protein
MKRVTTHILGVVLFIAFIASVALLLLANEDSFVSDLACEWIYCPTLPHAKMWKKLFYDLAVGYVVTYIFYLLVVRLPDRQKRKRLKRSLEAQYEVFRKNCIETILGVTNGGCSRELADRLMDQDNFRNYFKEKVAPRQDRWDQFANNLNDGSLREFRRHMEIFSDEIRFFLSNTDIPKDEPFEFLKHLSGTIYPQMRDTTADYDEEKPFLRFLWSLFAGWDWKSGYRKADIVKRMIDEI